MAAIEPPISESSKQAPGHCSTLLTNVEGSSSNISQSSKVDENTNSGSSYNQPDQQQIAYTQSGTSSEEGIFFTRSLDGFITLPMEKSLDLKSDVELDGLDFSTSFEFNLDQAVSNMSIESLQEMSNNENGSTTEGAAPVTPDDDNHGPQVPNDGEEFDVDFVTIAPNLGEIKMLPMQGKLGDNTVVSVKVLVDTIHSRYFVIHKQAKKFTNRFGGVRKVEECVWCADRQRLECTQPPTFLALKWYEKSKIRSLAGKVAEDPIFEVQTQFYLYRAGLTFTPPLLDFVHTSQTVYSLTEFVPKGSVIDYLTSGDCAWTTKDKLYVFRHMMLAVEKMHQLDMCHRDISPENFLLREDFTPFLIDFGRAARITEARATADRGVGKAYCMAPELFTNGGGYSPVKADVWALGITFVSILSNGGRIFGDCVLTSSNYKPIAVEQNFQYLQNLLGCLVPRDAVQLLLQIFQVDPYARPELHQLLQHSLFQ